MIVLSESERRIVDQHLSRKDVVLKLLRGAIIDGRLAPGLKLDQNEIAANFNVSRMPVREALKQLEAEGLVVVYPYRGVEVARLDVSEVSELFAIRGALERLAVAQAIDALRPESFAQLRSVLEQMDHMVTNPQETDDWSALNRTFHDTINAASGWPRLLETIGVYRDKLDRYVRLYFSIGGREQSQKEHWALLGALEARNRPEAERLIELHSNSTAGLLVMSIETANQAKSKS
jgi:DNA-binding GntR family transcriptional regulator|tara:strand:+ start:44547 stop:45248 length:702 start_codon:yes stop_codon:yes gene_type:complete